MSRSSISGLTVVDTETTFIGKQLIISDKSLKTNHLAETNGRPLETETNNYILYIKYVFQFRNKVVSIY